MRAKSPRHSPEFTKASPEMLDSVIEVGAAVVRGFLSPKSLAAFQQSYSLDFSIFMKSMKETAKFYKLLTSLNPDIYGNIDIAGPDPVSMSKPKSSYMSHIDTLTPHETVLTMLLPRSGGSALFAAHSKHFNLLEICEGDVRPDFLTEYGEGDAIFLRQSINEWNGQSVLLQPAHHRGFSDAQRSIIAVDFLQDDNALWTQPQAV